jgi:hypothetical protein
MPSVIRWTGKNTAQIFLNDIVEISMINYYLIYISLQFSLIAVVSLINDLLWLYPWYVLYTVYSTTVANASRTATDA